MDRVHTVSSFDEVGMADPFSTKTSLVDAVKTVKTFDFYTYVYPDEIV